MGRFWDRLAIDRQVKSGNQDHSTISHYIQDPFPNSHVMEDQPGLNGMDNAATSLYQ